MTSPHRLLAFSFVLALSGYGIANAEDASGTYNLTAGHASACSVTLAADGTASVGSDCKHVDTVTHWRPTVSGIQLQDNSRSTVAVLDRKDDGYKGGTFPDRYPLALTKSETVASH